MNNIILIGMPGSGKSSLGVVLAKKIGFGFIDSDLVIQQREGMTLERIIEKHGDAGFIQIENEVNCSISPHHTVIATGGSAVYGKEAMEHFKDIGTVVYLELPPESLEERLGSPQQVSSGLFLLHFQPDLLLFLLDKSILLTGLRSIPDTEHYLQQSHSWKWF